MTIHWISSERIEEHPVEELQALLDRVEGMVWVDIPSCDEQTCQMLSGVFACHPLAIKDCRQYNLVPKIHAYPEHLFIILHSLQPGGSSGLRRPELDQFVGTRYLLTIHTPPNELAPLDVGLQETRAVLARIQAGHWYPQSPAELSFAIVSGIVRQLEAYLSTLRTRVVGLEQNVIADGLKQPVRDLEEMFSLRHELLTVKTMLNQSRELYARAVTLAPRFLTAEGRVLVEDLLDQFTRLESMSDGEKAFLEGIIDFYQARTTTRMNIAAERLALLNWLLLPITTVASIYGMKMIVFDHTDFVYLGILLLILLILTIYMFYWAHRQGWWQ